METMGDKGRKTAEVNSLVNARIRDEAALDGGDAAKDEAEPCSKEQPEKFSSCDAPGIDKEKRGGSAGD